MAGSPGARLDPEVLSRLLLLNDFLQAAEPEHLLGMVARALHDVPGVGDARVCTTGAPGPGERVFFVGGTAGDRGGIGVTVVNPTVFAAYEPFVRNLLAAVSLRLDNVAQQAALEAAHDELDALVRRCSADLDVATREIASLSYAVSHELRSPLRAIDGYSALLEADAGPRLAAPDLARLGRIRAASRRMGMLLDDLVELLGVVRAPMRRVSVDLAALARTSVEQLRAADPDRAVVFSAPDHVVVEGDPDLLGLALRSLLDNAWKFTGPLARAHVTFGVEADEGGPVYFVRDDGVGFDAEQHAHLFEPFWRVHHATEYPGRGLGLAVALRAITRHGGRLWAESTPGAGATFRFTLRR